MEIRERDFEGLATGAEAVQGLGQLAKEREKTKRLLIGAACLLFTIAALVVVFAPTGRENLSYVLGAALLVVSLGAIGAAQFKFRVPGVLVETGSSLPPTSLRHNETLPRRSGKRSVPQ
jgi:hypothetical protein